MRYEDIKRAHANDYVQRVATGALLREEVRQINLPINTQLIKRSFLALTLGSCQLVQVQVCHQSAK